MKSETLYVCLGNWMDESALLNDESKERVGLLAQLSQERAGHVLFTGWPYRPDCNISIARAMANHFQRVLPQHTHVFLDEVARDTVGDAVCARLWCERHESYGVVHVVTSSYHVQRTQEIFRFVVSDHVKIEVSGAGQKLPTDVPQEHISLLAFRKTFEAIKAGDFPRILDRLISAHPYYNGVVYPAMKYDPAAKTLVPAKNEGTAL